MRAVPEDRRPRRRGTGAAGGAEQAAESGGQRLSPYYSRIKYSGQWKTDFLGYFDVQLGLAARIRRHFPPEDAQEELQVYFLDNEQYFNRPSAYGYPDDGERFAYFSRACLESLRYLGMQPDIVHCHDWQTALVPMLLNMQYRGDFPNTRSILTIHNIEYQGKCGLDFNRDVLGAPPQCDEILRFDDCQNFLKAGIVMADRVGTVSKTYAGGAALSLLRARPVRDSCLARRGVLRHRQRHQYGAVRPGREPESGRALQHKDHARG